MPVTTPAAAASSAPPMPGPAPGDVPADVEAASSESSLVVRPAVWAERVSFVIFWGIHVGCLAAIFTGVSVKSLVIAFILYWVRMFAITAGYHRYFSHRTYKTSRGFQFVLGALGCTSIQKGPLWWAAIHRKHHKFSDTPNDVHSPRQHGFWYSHVGWVSTGDHIETDLKVVKDLAKFPELVWLGKYYWVFPLALGIGCYLLDGWIGFVVGMGWSTVAAWHSTFTINSLSHVFGKVRYRTTDDSKNNWLLALITMGEGWHNNHHHYQYSANQGFYWWEVDASYYILKALSWVGVVWDLRKPPARVYAEAEAYKNELRVAAAAAVPTPAAVPAPAKTRESGVSVTFPEAA